MQACGSSSDSESSGSGSTSSSGGTGGSDPIKVAGIFDVTGTNAGFGAVYVDATRLAFDEVNAAGGINGHKLEMSMLDTATDPATATQAARRAVTRDGVRLLFGGVYDPPALAVADVAESTDALFYSPASVAPRLTTPTRRNIFAVDPTTAVQTDNMAALMQSMGARKVGLIKQTDGYGDETETDLEPQLERDGMTLAATAGIAADATDATNQVLAMQKAGVDAIAIGVAIPPSVAIIKAMAQQGVRIPVVAVGGGLSDPADRLLTSSAPIEYYAVSPLACPLGVGGCGTDFIRAYEARFNERPIVWAAQGYVAALAFANALRNAKDYSPQGVSDALETTAGYTNPLLPGAVRFTPDQHLGVQTVYLQGYRDGRASFFGNDVNDNKWPARG
ncbi:ABC transporter substrate-binding protein [Conexibacter sp. CPCC 206217]|uniref:ABC transporter substrate-binding protein n=1 Tax=Conexibacter sp. CPCC 206217 TaxID=3064574 RepID=UPI0027255112|nr:ABC transporter substrate-binding protein [Conexibacter sp. CPCC 206217]MDO8211101.1 ABC transporter substrate-binding protein [Conexibacter sp. CPCC 206217]